VAKTPLEKVDDIPPEQLPDYLAALPAAEKVIEAIRDRAKKILNAGGHVGNWYIRAGAKMPTITNNAGLFTHLNETYGCTSKEFIQMVSMPQKNLKTYLGETFPDMQPSQLKAIIKGLNEEFGRFSRKAGSLTVRKD